MRLRSWFSRSPEVQTFLQTIPVAKGDKRGRHAQLVLIRLLGALGQIVGHLIARKVNAGDLRDHPTVKFLVGVLAAHEVIDFLRVFDLLVVVVAFLFSDRDTDLGSRDLLVDLLYL